MTEMGRSLIASATPGDPLLGDHVANLSAIAAALGHHHEQYNSVLHRLAATSPSVDNSLKDVGDLRGKFEQHKQWHDRTINTIKAELQGQGRDRDILASIRGDLSKAVEEEIKRQAKGVLDAQVGNLVPSGPETRVEDAQNQLRAMDSLLQNSKARMANSYIQREDLDDPLSPVVDKQGVGSDIYPKDLRALLGYDKTQLKRLLNHYELLVDDNWVCNINRFLTHIGINFHISAVHH